MTPEAVLCLHMNVHICAPPHMNTYAHKIKESGSECSSVIEHLLAHAVLRTTQKY